MQDVKVARLGGYQVLLSFDDVDAAFQLIKEFHFEFSEIFASLDRWVPGPNRSCRSIWVRCFGVPLHSWNSKVFENIGRRFGEVLGVAKEIVEKVELECGRVCIQTECQFFYQPGNTSKFFWGDV